LPSTVGLTTRECVHLVTRGHFRLRDKDGCHTHTMSIRHRRETLCSRKHHVSVFYRTGVIAVLSIEVLHCVIGIFDLLCSCDLELDPMTFIYELDPYFLEIYRMCKYEPPTSRLSIVSLSADRHRPTDQRRPKLYTMPLRGWSKYCK